MATDVLRKSHALLGSFCVQFKSLIIFSASLELYCMHKNVNTFTIVDARTSLDMGL